MADDAHPIGIVRGLEELCEGAIAAPVVHEQEVAIVGWALSQRLEACEKRRNPILLIETRNDHGH